MGSRTGSRKPGDQEPVSRITEDLLDALPEVAPLAEEDVEVGELAPLSTGHLGITMEA